jgi:Chromatin modification-related protein EAF7
MISILNSINAQRAPSETRITLAELKTKLNELYNMDGLEELEESEDTEDDVKQVRFQEFEFPFQDFIGIIEDRGKGVEGDCSQPTSPEAAMSVRSGRSGGVRGTKRRREESAAAVSNTDVGTDDEGMAVGCVADRQMLLRRRVQRPVGRRDRGRRRDNGERLRRRHQQPRYRGSDVARGPRRRKAVRRRRPRKMKLRRRKALLRPQVLRRPPMADRPRDYARVPDGRVDKRKLLPGDADVDGTREVAGEGAQGVTRLCTKARQVGFLGSWDY